MLWSWLSGDDCEGCFLVYCWCLVVDFVGWVDFCGGVCVGGG